MNIKQIETKLEEKKSYLEENFHIEEIGILLGENKLQVAI